MGDNQTKNSQRSILMNNKINGIDTKWFKFREGRDHCETGKRDFMEEFERFVL